MTIIRSAWNKTPMWFKVAYRNRRIKKRLGGLNVATALRHRLERPDDLAFCIVHYNAPDFLELNVRQLSKLHPRSKVYILDNGSAPEVVVDLGWLREYPNVEFMVARGESEHAVGLQYLLEHSAKQGDKYACFLDHDCILADRLLKILGCLGYSANLIGPQYLSTPDTALPGMIHSSLAILDPVRTFRAYGRHAFDFIKTNQEPMFGISQRCAGHILFLKHSFNDPHEGISTYYYGNDPVAWHSWYSSRLGSLPDSAILDGKLVGLRRARRARNLEFLRGKVA